MIFHHFPSIENIETAEDSRMFAKASEIVGWAITEKIDGTNFSINISPDEIKLGKRSGFIGENENFYNVQNSYKEILENKIKDFQKGYNWNDVKQITLYGEYFGNNVMNRIHYGKEGYFRFFAGYIITEDTHWFSFQELENFFSLYFSLDLLVPVLKFVDTFEEACQYQCNGINTFKQSENEMEGIVFHPLNVTPVYGHDTIMFKKKNPKFAEKTARKPKELLENISELDALKEKFLEYCTESRMYGVFSKNGIPSEKEVGKFLGIFIEDAKTDFLKENEVQLDNKEMKYISNIGGKGFILFKKVKNALEKNV